MDPVIQKQVEGFLANHKMFAIISESFLFWLSVGQTREFAAGLCAQEYAESTSNSHALGDHGQAFGLFQFHPNRCEAIRKGCGVDMQKFPPHLDQLKGAWWEFQHDEKHAYAHIAAAKTAYDAGHAAAQYWERPAKATDWDRRGGIAQMFLAAFDAHGVGVDTRGHA